MHHFAKEVCCWFAISLIHRSYNPVDKWEEISDNIKKNISFKFVILSVNIQTFNFFAVFPVTNPFFLRLNFLSYHSRPAATMLNQQFLFFNFHPLFIVLYKLHQYSRILESTPYFLQVFSPFHLLFWINKKENMSGL